MFTDEPGAERMVWLFSLVLGHSRMLWGRFVLHQDLQTLLRCHAAAFEALGGVPEQILYDRMRTVFSREDPEAGHIVYNRTLLEFARHYGYLPKACKPYRAKTKGKVERPFRYIREDFFLGRSFRNLDDLNMQFRQWLDQVANVRVHATTRRVVAEHFAEERPTLQQLPAGPFQAVLRLERRITRDGMVSVDGNLYSVPNTTRRRVRRSAQHGQRGAHSRGRPRHCRASRPGWARPAAHHRRPPDPAAAGQQPNAPQRRAWRRAFRRGRRPASPGVLRRRRQTPRRERCRGMRGDAPPAAPIERIRSHLVGLRMPRALETLDHVVQQLERGQISAIEAIETLLAEEITIRESRRIKAALQMARLATIKTLSGSSLANVMIILVVSASVTLRC